VLLSVGWLYPNAMGSSYLLRAIREPWRVPRALVRRLFPRSRDWVRRPDGSVTFRSGGFVAAPSQEMLLARHNFETLLIQSLLAGRAFKRSLEVGCGFGRLSLHYARFSANHVAVDINDAALGAASATYPGIDFRLASATDLPFADQEFDLVSTWTVLQHIPPGAIERAAHEVDRVLARPGTLLICEETRLADDALALEAWHTHTWHRSVATYQALFPSLTLVSDGFIDQLDRIPSMTSPGRVMLFQRY
jgi:SAM-dependent methyltransferase